MQNSVRRSDIGVITPYNAQVNLIKKHIRQSKELHNSALNPNKDFIEVSTVDGF